MPWQWRTDELIGTKDGSNTTFTVPFTLLDNPSLTVFHNGRILRRVSSGAVAGQFSISGSTVTLGLAPASGDEVWCRGRETT